MHILKRVYFFLRHKKCRLHFSFMRVSFLICRLRQVWTAFVARTGTGKIKLYFSKKD